MPIQDNDPYTKCIDCVDGYTVQYATTGNPIVDSAPWGATRCKACPHEWFDHDWATDPMHSTTHCVHCPDGWTSRYADNTLTENGAPPWGHAHTTVADVAGTKCWACPHSYYDPDNNPSTECESCPDGWTTHMDNSACTSSGVACGRAVAETYTGNFDCPYNPGETCGKVSSAATKCLRCAEGRWDHARRDSAADHFFSRFGRLAFSYCDSTWTAFSFPRTASHTFV